MGERIEGGEGKIEGSEGIHSVLHSVSNTCFLRHCCHIQYERPTPYNWKQNEKFVIKSKLSFFAKVVKSEEYLFYIQWNPAPRHPPIRQCPPIRHFKKVPSTFSVVLSTLALRHFPSKA